MKTRNSKSRKAASPIFHNRISSRKAKLRVNSFIKELTKKTSFNIHNLAGKGDDTDKKLQSFLQELTETETNNDINKKFTAYTNKTDMFTNDMITSALFELEPKPGVIICSVEVGHNLLGAARVLRNAKKTDTSKEIYNQFKNAFTNKHYAEEDMFVHTIIIPMCIDSSHYGILVLKRCLTTDKERRTVWWGDSLGQRCPRGTREVLKICMDEFYGSCSSYFIASENYMLDVHKYWKQEDGYSCGAYVVALCAEYAKSHGVVPTGTFETGYNPELTDKIRWACMLCRVNSVIDACRSGGYTHPNEFEVREFERNNRRTRYKIRHITQKAEKMAADNGSCTDEVMKNNALETEESEILFPVHSILHNYDDVDLESYKSFELTENQDVPDDNDDLPQNNVLKNIDDQDVTVGKFCRMRANNEVKFKDSYEIVSEIIEGMILDVTKACKQLSNDRALCLDTTETDNYFSLPFNLPDNIGEIPMYMDDFARFGSYFSREGYAYVLHFCRSLKKSKKYSLSARIRCSNFKSGCKSAFIGKQDIQKKEWEITGSNQHFCSGWKRKNELPGVEAVKRWITQQRKNEFTARFQSLTWSIANQLSTTEREEYLESSKCPPCPKLVELKLNIPNISNGTSKGRNSGKNTRDFHSEELFHSDVERKRGEILSSIQDLADVEPPAFHDSIVDCIPDNEEGMKVLEDEQLLIVDEFLDGDPELASSMYGLEELERVMGFIQDGSNATASSDEIQRKVASLDELWTCQGETMRYKIGGYVSLLPENAPGFDVLQQVKHLSNTFGYFVKVRSSQYWDNTDSHQSLKIDSNKVLRYAFIECNRRKHGHRRCNFQLIIKSVPTDKQGQVEDPPRRKSSQNASFQYYCDLTNAFHEHNGSETELRQYIPVEMLREGRHLVNTVEMKFNDVVQYLQTKHNVVIDKNLFRKQLAYLKNSDTPKDKECLRLCQALMCLGRENSNNKVFFTSNEDTTMHSTAWVLAEWLEDYVNYGIVPGVCIDCKAIANRFGLPLITINGRTNCGQVCTFFMGFLPDTTEESFTWALSSFKEVIPVSPAMIYVDQDMACISAIRSVFSSSVICLDDWHINKNQMRNVITYCRSINQPTLYRSLSNQLFFLRNTTGLTTFLSGRESLERTFFYQYQRNPPRWYNFLYRENPEMICVCYKDINMSRRFLFQGTGYTEASNSSFRSHILGKKTRVAQIPEEMKKITLLRRQDRRNSEPKTINAVRNKLGEINLGLAEETLDIIVQNFTPYSIRKFIDLSVKASGHYYVSDTTICLLEEMDTFLDDVAGRKFTIRKDQTACVFRVRRRPSTGVVDNDCSRNPTYSVVLFHEQGKGSEHPSIRCFCTCRKATVNGFPCRHIVRAVHIYPEEASRNELVASTIGNEIPFECLWHPYWAKSSEDWNHASIAEVRYCQRNEKQKEGAEQNEDADDNVGDIGKTDIDQHMEKINNNTTDHANQLTSTDYGQELQRYASYANGKSLYDQMHRLASSYGRPGIDGLMKFLQWGLSVLTKGGNLGTLTFYKRKDVIHHLTGTVGNGSDVQNSTLHITNPNSGSIRNQKRKKGWFEFQVRNKRAKVEPEKPK